MSIECVATVHQIETRQTPVDSTDSKMFGQPIFKFVFFLSTMRWICGHFSAYLVERFDESDVFLQVE